VPQSAAAQCLTPSTASCYYCLDSWDVDCPVALPPVRYDAYVPTEDRIQLLERDYAAYKVDSFAIDVSPTNTTATALSLLTAGGLAPCSHADYDTAAVPLVGYLSLH
jgi:hypothetical protein